MKAAMATWVLCLVSFSAHAAEEFGGISRLDMRVSFGNVKVLAGTGSTASVEVVKKRYDERCALTMEKRGDLLYIELASKSLFSARCEADFTLRVPKAIDLKFKEGAGNISVAGTEGPMTIEMGSGKVDVKARITEFDAKSGSGEVRIEGLEASAEVRTGSGRIRLVYSKVPAEGELILRSGSGSAEVLFPKNTKIRTTFSAGSGRLKNRLGDSADAHFLVSMKTGSGDLVVNKF